MYKRKQRTLPGHADTDATLELLERNYDRALYAATMNQWFNWIGTGIGFLVILFGVYELFISHITEAILSTAAGTIINYGARTFSMRAKEADIKIDSMRKELIDHRNTLYNRQEEIDACADAVEIAATIADEEERDAIKKEIIWKRLQLAQGMEIKGQGSGKQLEERTSK